MISKQFVGQAVKILRGCDLQPFSQTTHVRQLSLQMQRWHVGKSGTNLPKKEMVRLLREWGRPSDDLSSKVAVADSPQPLRCYRHIRQEMSQRKSYGWYRGYADQTVEKMFVHRLLQIERDKKNGPEFP